jgi:hypothetical protein
MSLTGNLLIGTIRQRDKENRISELVMAGIAEHPN